MTNDSVWYMAIAATSGSSKLIEFYWEKVSASAEPADVTGIDICR